MLRDFEHSGNSVIRFGLTLIFASELRARSGNQRRFSIEWMRRKLTWGPDTKSQKWSWF
jgi:hypothetical protein